MVWQQALVFLTLFISLLKIQQVVCSGVFELRLKTFINENGKDSLGHCCGGGDWNGRCIGPCRTRFRVCLKHYQNQIDLTSTCTFGDVMTPVLGENNVYLADAAPTIAGFTNPIRFPFDFSWPGWFSLIVEAWHDATPNNTADDAGVSSKTSSVSIGGRELISRFPMQQWLDVKNQWTEKKQESQNVKLLFEFRVTCDAHYYGSGCANLCRPRDDNFGHYNCSTNGEIVCLDGWKGDYCTKPRCSSGCDETHGYCSKPGECLCHSGWQGKMCNECERYPGCMHGSCQKPWDCLCDEGWGGLFCNQDLNYCTNHKPCRNGGTCFNTGQGSYTCSCPPGYTGMDCDKKLSDCSHKPCLNGATCKENGTSYQCECLKGWYGNHCEIAMQTCEDRPCLHGGTCMDSIHGYKCSCPAGYSGPQCQHAVDHCSPNPCANKGNCTLAATNSGFECKCPIGYGGPRCQTNIDDCHGNPCGNGGSCIDLVNNYRCQCVPGYAGQLCETEVDVCLTKPCANGGTCEPLLNDYQCKCRPSFRGRDCSIHVNECVNQNPCRNGGTCYSGQNGVECECRSGFSGTFCEYESSSNAVSTAIVGNISRHVAVAGGATGDESLDKLMRVDWYLIVLVSVAVPTVVLVAALVLKCSKQRRQREQKKADEEARLQNEQNSVHSSVTKHGDTHMIKNTWGQCPPAKKMETDNADLCYPKQVSYAVVPAAAAVIDHNLAPVAYTLQRSRSQKQLNIDPPPLHRHSVCNRVVSCKDLDSIVRSTTPAPLDNRLSVLSINISHSNLSDSSLSTKQQHCSQLLDKESSKSVQNNTLNSSGVLNGSSGGLGGSVYVIDEHFAQTLFATEV